MDPPSGPYTTTLDYFYPQVPLVTVLSQEKTLLEGKASTTRQVFSLHSHITPPTGHTHLSAPSLGKLSVVLVLEDLGPIRLADSALLQRAMPTSVGVGSSHHVPPKEDGLSGDHVTGSQSHVTSHVTGVQDGVGGGTAAKPEASGGREGGGKGRGITDSSEYAVAMELEMWKLAEEEAFKVS